MKSCSKCGSTKALTEFSPSARGLFGRQSQCRACRSEYQREYHKTERGRQVSRSYIASPKGRAKQARHQQARRARDPLKNAARRAVNRAVRDGRLEKCPCDVCGASRTQGHHESYERARWLDVRWLCHKHHAAVHAASE